MEPRDHSEDDEHRRNEPIPEEESAAAIAADHGDSPDPAGKTMVVETHDLSDPGPAPGRQPVVVPVKTDPVPAVRRSASHENRKGAAGPPSPHQKKSSESTAQGPSLTRRLILSGVVGVGCGVVGAGVYWHFFGSSKSGEKNSQAKNEKPSEEDSSKGKLRQMEAAWNAAVKELQQEKTARQNAQNMEQQTKAILDFLRRTLLSAGRPAESSLSTAFWQGGKGKDVAMSKALDLADARAKEGFVDRPLAEASIREMLGLGYLNVGETAKAVKQYERAFALRTAMEGASHPETAACRNQLAIAYRLDGQTKEASDLFERSLNSTDDANALAVQGSALLLEKRPADAELTLRSCLAIRRKLQPNDWSTFDTESTLGEALVDLKRYQDAEPFLLESYEGLKLREDRIPTDQKHRISSALERLVKLYEEWGRQDPARKWRNTLQSGNVIKKS